MFLLVSRPFFVAPAQTPPLLQLRREKAQEEISSLSANTQAWDEDLRLLVFQATREEIVQWVETHSTEIL
jgi:hypothetical protein